jgi:hypothetical protein
MLSLGEFYLIKCFIVKLSSYSDASALLVPTGSTFVVIFQQALCQMRKNWAGYFLLIILKCYHANTGIKQSIMKKAGFKYGKGVHLLEKDYISKRYNRLVTFKSVDIEIQSATQL